MVVEVRLRMDPGFSHFATMFQIVAEGVDTGTSQLHEEGLELSYTLAQENFENSIKRPAFSDTAGGTVYRPGSRATGKFTFGVGQTFEGETFDRPNQRGFGFPKEDQADAATDRAWRRLEEGVTSMTMPVGFWRDASGGRVEANAGGDDELVPVNRGSRTVQGIEAKLFILRAMDVVFQKMEAAYGRLADEVVQMALAETPVDRNVDVVDIVPVRAYTRVLESGKRGVVRSHARNKPPKTKL